MTPAEIKRLETYLQDKFENDAIKLVKRPKLTDSVEMTLDGEFMGVVYRDEDEGEISYSVSISILSEDLP